MRAMVKLHLNSATSVLEVIVAPPWATALSCAGCALHNSMYGCCPLQVSVHVLNNSPQQSYSLLDITCNCDYKMLKCNPL